MSKIYEETRFNKLVILDSIYNNNTYDELFGYTDKIGKDILEYLEEFPNKSSKIQNILNHWAIKILIDLNNLNVDISKTTYSKLIYSEHKSKFNITKLVWNNKYTHYYLDVKMLQYLNDTGLCNLKKDTLDDYFHSTLLDLICNDYSPCDYVVHSYELIKYLIDIGSDINGYNMCGSLSYYLHRDKVEMRIVRLFFRKTNPIPLEYNEVYLRHYKSDSINRKKITKYILRKHIKMIE